MITSFVTEWTVVFLPDPAVLGHGHFESERGGDQGGGERHLPGDDLDLAQLCQKNVLLARVLRVLQKAAIYGASNSIFSRVHHSNKLLVFFRVSFAGHVGTSSTSGVRTMCQSSVSRFGCRKS